MDPHEPAERCFTLQIREASDFTKVDELNSFLENNELGYTVSYAFSLFTENAVFMYVKDDEADLQKAFSFLNDKFASMADCFECRPL
ncbi:MAG: hypothetical protein MRY83_06335 [Flavobacteriales bacterium]|nr:hypothetical protein [Flavobacteriales bacterium]